MIDYEMEIRKKAKELLENKEVSLVIGYGAGSLPNRAIPVFIDKPEDADKLVFNRFCSNNLSVYLGRFKDKGKLAIVAKPCDVRAIVTLIQEKQVERDKIHIISFSCPGLLEPDGQYLFPICASCEITTPPVCDARIGGEEKIKIEGQTRVIHPDFDSLSPEERWQIIQEEMKKCIRCYACRNACPLCYCEECFVERTLPRWVGEGSELSDTLIFHIVRALHSAGRCGECGACVRACP
ncbi:4Fe-4S ferredoxin, partial [Candidatus Sumerlaeota bacterium]|nr:4Fe-4S ferredoxin [Candidatus Sumerlaeota bacterium]